MFALNRKKSLYLSTFAFLMGCAADVETNGVGEKRVDEPESISGDSNSSIASQTAAPQLVVDRKGNRWRNRGPAKVAAWRELSPEHFQGVSDAQHAQKTPEELANELRPVAYSNGYEYALEATDEEVLRKLELAREMVVNHPQHGRPSTFGLEEGTQLEQPAENAAGPVPVPRRVTPQIIDTDDRQAVTNVGDFPGRAVAVLASLSTDFDWDGGFTGGCTMTLIGPSTAISAAHCFYTSGSGWHPQKSWAFGVRSTSTSRTVTYGTYKGCYWVTIPTAFTTAGTIQNDYAVIEFSNSQGPNCDLAPGSTLGWYGWAVATDTQVVGKDAALRGYPAGIPSFSSLRYPSQFTHALPAGWVWPDPSRSHVLLHVLDTTGGQSGSAVAQFLYGGIVDRYATGIHVGAYGSYNQARRIDSTVASFIYANSAL